MALFDPRINVQAAPRRPRPRAGIVGLWALVVAIVALLILSLLPTSFVIQQPGPVYNTLGSAQDEAGKQRPLIQISGHKTYPTDGSLDMLTVQVMGSPEHPPSWFELATAWFDRSRAVVPMDAVYPQGVSSKQIDQENAQMMTDSQTEATAAALTHLGYPVDPQLKVYSVVKGSGAQKKVLAGDLIVSADGTAVTDADSLRAIVAKGQGAPVNLVLTRDGRTVTTAVTPKKTTSDGTTSWVMGITLLQDFHFPFTVNIQLDNVGGPSAGMMFALGIIDKLTPGDLNGGKQVAGTGTIDAQGNVGAIGGIRQKLYGARAAGAKYFLAPSSNCDEVVGHIPSGLRVFAVSKLDDSVKVLDTLREDGNLNALPTCIAKK